MPFYDTERGSEYMKAVPAAVAVSVYLQGNREGYACRLIRGPDLVPQADAFLERRASRAVVAPRANCTAPRAVAAVA